MISQIDPSGAIAEILDMDSQLVEQRHIQVRHWRVFRISDVTATLDTGSSAGHQQNGEVFIKVHVAVAQSAAVHEQRVIEQGPVAIGHRPHLFQEILVQRSHETH